MDESMKQRCPGTDRNDLIIGGPRLVCRSEGVFEHGGKWWCYAHHPERARRHEDWLAYRDRLRNEIIHADENILKAVEELYEAKKRREDLVDVLRGAQEEHNRYLDNFSRREGSNG